MTKITPRSIAGLAMCLCHRIGLENDTPKGKRAMQGVYVVARDVVAEIQKSDDPEMPKDGDMDNGKWLVIFASIVAQVSAERAGHVAKIEQQSNMVMYVMDALETYKEAPDVADKIARVVLENLYPQERNLTDGHHRASGGSVFDIP